MGWPRRFGLLIALVGGACQTVEPKDSAKAPPESPRPVRQTTVLPSHFTPRLGSLPRAPVVVPPGLLRLSAVVRPRASLWTGPGSRYELADALLAEGTQVIVQARRGLWRKVLVPKGGQVGWMHAQALGPPRLNDHPLILDAARLATVQTVREVEQVGAHPSRQPLRTRIPKGAMFHALQATRSGNLVWVPETDSVMWLSWKDVQ